MVMGKVRIEDDLGIHLRPAGQIADEGLKYRCRIELCCNGRRVNGKSLLSILSLGVRKGSEIEIFCDGEDEAEALQALIKAVNTKASAVS